MGEAAKVAFFSLFLPLSHIRVHGSRVGPSPSLPPQPHHKHYVHVRV